MTRFNVLELHSLPIELAELRRTNNNNVTKLNQWYAGLLTIETLAEEAKQTSDDAKEQSQTAEEKADSYQTQLDTVINEATEGDEVLQARVDGEGTSHANLNERLVSDVSKRKDEDEEIRSELEGIAHLMKPSMTAEEIDEALSTYSNFIWTKGMYMCNPLTFPGGSTHLFHEGAILQAKEGFEMNDRLLEFATEQSDVFIHGHMTLKMNGEEYTEGEQRHCLYFSKYAENIYIETVSCYDSGGDGICIGSYKEIAKNIRIKNAYLYNHRRQGLSVISVDGWSIDHLYIDGVEGTDPQCGIDFEPNFQENVLKNIKMKNVEIHNAAKSGVYFYFKPFTDVNPVDITIDKLSINGCDRGAVFHGSSAKVLGRINIPIYEAENINGGGIVLLNWYVGMSPLIKMPENLLRNCNENNSQNSDTSSWILQRNSNEEETELTLGNLIMGDVHIEDTRDSQQIFNLIYSENLSGSEKAELKIKSLSPFKPNNERGIVAEGIVDINDYNLPLSTTGNINTNFDSTTSSAPSEYNNTGATGEVIIKPNMNTVGNRVKIKVTEAEKIIVQCDDPNNLYPSNPIESSVIGSYLIAEKISDDNYAIVEKIGSWNPS